MTAKDNKEDEWKTVAVRQVMKVMKMGIMRKGRRQRLYEKMEDDERKTILKMDDRRWLCIRGCRGKRKKGGSVCVWRCLWGGGGGTDAREKNIRVILCVRKQLRKK